MKEEYVLYLDESEHRKSKDFTIAGLSIKKSEVPSLETKLKEIKKLIWDETYIQLNSPILHATDLNNIYINRNKTNYHSLISEPYNMLAQKTPIEIEKTYQQVYGRLSNILRTSNITIFSCIIDTKRLYDLFYLDETHDGIHMIDDIYNIALQKVIENYTHYLSCSDGYGDVLYESRNTTGENSSNSPDIKLINNFHQIHANNRGIIYTNNKIIQERNRLFQTPSKSSDIAGLQLADFIAYNILKFYHIKDSTQVTDFMKQLHRFSYNGGRSLDERDQRGFWGMRILPSYPQMFDLLKSNKSLINANNNLKKERTALKREIAKLNDIVNKQKLELQKYNELSIKKSPTVNPINCIDSLER